RSKRAGSSSRPSVRRASTTAPASRMEASRRRCWTPRLAARSNRRRRRGAPPRFPTLELKVNLPRPITKEAGLLRCEAKVVHVGGRTATSEGRIVDRNGKLYAHGTTTCIVVDAPRGPLEP